MDPRLAFFCARCRGGGGTKVQILIVFPSVFPPPLPPPFHSRFCMYDQILHSIDVLFSHSSASPKRIVLFLEENKWSRKQQQQGEACRQVSRSRPEKF